MRAPSTIPTRYCDVDAARRGAATLPTIIALTMLILAVGISITTVSFTEGLLSLDQQRASQALSYAEAGSRDALIKIARNRNYTCPGQQCYSVEFVSGGCSANDGCARVSVSAGAGSSADPRVIVSEGRSGDSVRRIEVDVVFDPTMNGEIATTTWKEL